MEEIKCKNCSGNDLVFRNGFYVCQNCGSKYMIHNELSRQVEELEDKLITSIHNEKYEKTKKHADALLRIDSNNAYAWVGLMMYEIAEGIKSYNAGRIVDAAQKAADYAQSRKDDEREDIEDCIKNHFRMYYYRIMEVDASQKEKEEKLMRQLNCDAADVAEKGLKNPFENNGYKSLWQQDYEKKQALKEAARSRVPEHVTSIYDFTVSDAEGNRTELKDYRGKVVLIVNSVTRWSQMSTISYQKLRELYKEYHDQGLEILEFPSEEFNNRYPLPVFNPLKSILFVWDNKRNNHFKRFGSVYVNGEKESMLYSYLKSEMPGEVDESFTAYLIGRDGTVLYRDELGYVLKMRIEEALQAGT